jgi:Uncharacterized conserved protein
LSLVKSEPLFRPWVIRPSHPATEKPHRFPINAFTLDWRFDFRDGDGIHTENSYKYTVAEFQDLAGKAGFSAVRAWTDPERLFSVHYLKAAGSGKR